jgi:hypothetical protein
MNATLFLSALSGICWTLVYVDCARLGIKEKTYAMPFWALALNASWEFLHTVIGYQTHGLTLQVGINAAWLLVDAIIVFTYFKYGQKYFPKTVNPQWFVPYSILVFAMSLAIQYFFIQELGLVKGGGYAAFIQNLLMSVLFLPFLLKRQSTEGQSMLIAICKGIGTLAPTILFGVLGEASFGAASPLVLCLGVCCAVFDIVYILALNRVKNGQTTPYFL